MGSVLSLFNNAIGWEIGLQIPKWGKIFGNQSTENTCLAIFVFISAESHEYLKCNKVTQ